MATSQKLVLCCQSKFAKRMCFRALFAVLNSSVRASGLDWPGAGHRCRVCHSHSQVWEPLFGVLLLTSEQGQPHHSGAKPPLGTAASLWLLLEHRACLQRSQVCQTRFHLYHSCHSSWSLFGNQQLSSSILANNLIIPNI